MKFNRIFIFLLIVCAQVVKADSLIELPEDKRSNQVLQTISDSILRKFRTRISDLRKTYSSKLLDNKFYLIYRNGDSGCGQKILPSESNMQIAWTENENNNRLTETITYSACDEADILKEVLVREGQSIKKLSTEDVLSLKRPIAVSTEQSSVNYRILTGDGVEQFSYFATRDQQGFTKALITIQGQKAFDLYEYKTQDKKIHLQMQRYPFTATVQIGRSRSSSQNGGTTQLFALESKTGPVYLRDQEQVQISESDWNELFNSNISKSLGANGAAMILETYSSAKLPESKKVVLSGGVSEKMLKELSEIKDLVISGRNQQRVEAVLNDYIDAVNKGFIKDERP